MNILFLIAVILLIISGGIFLFSSNIMHEISIDSTMLGKTDTGTVEKHIYGNASANNTIALITGIHPREPLSIEPEIKAAKEYVRDHEDVKIIHYEVNVTKDPQDYEKGRYNGEHLVHDYVNPDVTSSDADCVIISHSHIPTYGEGFYVATPEMDDASVEISHKTEKYTCYDSFGSKSLEVFRRLHYNGTVKPIAVRTVDVYVLIGNVDSARHRNISVYNTYLAVITVV